MSERLVLLGTKVDESKFNKKSSVSLRTVKSRKISFLLQFLNNVKQPAHRKKLFRKIKSLFKEIKIWTMGDIYLMREVALQGGKLGFLDKILTEGENETPLLIGSENWEDICVMIEEYEGDPEKSYDSDNLKQDREKSKKYILGLLRRKEINVKEFIKV